MPQNSIMHLPRPVLVGLASDPLVFRVLRLVLRGSPERLGVDEFATLLGFPNRHRLNRAMRRVGLPSAATLIALRRLVGLLPSYASAGDSLCSRSLHWRVDPAWAYRTVKQLTGRNWSQLRNASAGELLRLALSRTERLPRKASRSIAA